MTPFNTNFCRQIFMVQDFSCNCDTDITFYVTHFVTWQQNFLLHIFRWQHFKIVGIKTSSTATPHTTSRSRLSHHIAIFLWLFWVCAFFMCVVLLMWIIRWYYSFNWVSFLSNIPFGTPPLLSNSCVTPWVLSLCVAYPPPGDFIFTIYRLHRRKHLECSASSYEIFARTPSLKLKNQSFRINYINMYVHSPTCRPLS